jgi:DNA-binding NarL/FixJ family response regulator
MEIKLVIVEDDAEIREWIVDAVTSAEGILCLAAFPDAESCIKKWNHLEPDIVLMDIHLPGINGIECLSKLKPVKPAVQFLMFTVFEDDNHVFESLCAGAAGYLLKNTSREGLISGIQDLYKGGSPMSSTIARKVIMTFQAAGSNADEYSRLSNREKEILNLLAKGYRYKEIAEQLHISLDTVRTHIRNIYDKLQVQSRTEALNKIYPRN